MLKRLLGALRPGSSQVATESPPDALEHALAAGRAAYQAGRLDEALEIAESVAQRFPSNDAPLVLAAEVHLRAARPVYAEHAALAALRRRGPGIEAHMVLARALSAQGRDEEAVLAMRQGEGRDPQQADFWNEYGLLHLALGNADLAVPRFRRAAALDPRLAAPLINLAILEQGRGAVQAAVAYLKKAIDRNPEDGLAWSNYGLALRDSERITEAVSALRRAVELRPQHAQTRVNLGTVLLAAERVTEAEVEFMEALRVAPDLETARVGLAQVALRRGDAEAALQLYMHASGAGEDAHIARAGMGELQLWLRDFEHGWDNYECRFGGGSARRFPYPQWEGQPLDSGALLVHAEQGIGDMILFASCLTDVRVAGPVVLEAPERLVSLFARSFPRVQVVPYAGDARPLWLERVPPIAATIPAGSLMRLFRRKPADFPRHGGYLQADPERVARWHERLAAHGPGPKVGISWRGGTAKTAGGERTIDPGEWLPILEVEAVHAISLQYTPDAAAAMASLRERFGVDVVHWQEAIDDYEETAALVAALDVVVTVCTAVAHLAGALGTPVWILAPATPSWRYLGAGEDLPWYPSATVFRQTRDDGWGPLIDRVADELRRKFGRIDQKKDVAPRATRRGYAPGATGAEQSATMVTPMAPASEASVPERAARLIREGDPRAAVRLMEEALAADPAWAEGYATLARAYTADGDREAAADCIELALHHEPDNVSALWLSCQVNDALGRLEPAIDALSRIVTLGSGGAEARCSLARLHYRNRQYDRAESIAASALAEHPGLFDALDVLGIARIGLEDYEGAIAPLEQLLAIRPGSTSVMHYLAVAYLHRARFDESRELLDWVLAREPHNYHASWHYAYIELAHRRFETGWQKYELRRHLPERPPITANYPRWRGDALDGRTLLILGEQGLGDEIMFASCFEEALASGGGGIVTCDPRLVTLFRRSFGNLTVLDETRVGGSDLDRADVEILSGTLPSLYRRSNVSFPRRRGYLRADPARVEYWRQRLRGLGGERTFGLSWRGGTALTRTKLRSLALEDLAPLLRIPGLRFVSLQYGEVREDLDRLRQTTGIDLPHFPEVIPDYDDTAALVSALDGVVSVCTSIVHLTGALGRPVFVLVPSVPEWRYGVEGREMPWYPSAELFRQTWGEPWAAVVERVARTLPPAG